MFLTGNDVSVLERPAAKKYVHSDRFKSPYRNITAKSKAANPKLQLDNQSFFSNNNTNVLIPSHAKKSTSNSIGKLKTKCNKIFFKNMTCYVTAIHQLDAEKGKVNDMEAAEPVALPCVTTEDMFQEPTSDTLLHIPPEKEMASEWESQLRVEFEPNDMEVDELIVIGAVEVSNVCDGIVELSLANVCVTSRCSAVKDGKIIRSNRCTGLTENNVCLNCKFLKKNLMTRNKQLGCKAERTGIQKKNQQQKRNLAMRRILQQGKVIIFLLFIN